MTNKYIEAVENAVRDYVVETDPSILVGERLEEVKGHAEEFVFNNIASEPERERLMRLFDSYASAHHRNQNLNEVYRGFVSSSA